MKRFFSFIVLSATIALTLPNAMAQTAKTQRTTVVKPSYDNPTIAIADFKGTQEMQKFLENAIMRCGWLKLVPNTQNAQIKLTVNATQETTGTVITGAILLNASSYPVAAEHANTRFAILRFTDEILKKLFGIPPVCTKRIVFARQIKPEVKELYSCFLDGSGQERLTFNEGFSSEPAWGHSNALVYTLNANNALFIIMMDVLNKRQRIVSSAPGLNSSSALSHDGKKLALVLSEKKCVDVYVIDLNTKQKTRISKDNAVESAPCWSPDDKTICFASDATGIGAPRLYTAPADGSTPPKRLQTGGGEAVSPDWSKINNKLCFATKSATGNYAIAVLDMNQPNPTPEIVTPAGGDWEAPSWAPDGRHIICTRAANGKRDLVVVDAILGSFMPLTKGANVSQPAWQP